MQRIVAETVNFMHLTFIDTIVPVNFKKATHESGNFIDFIAIEGNNADSQNISQVRKRIVLARLTFKFARKAVFCLDAAFDCIDVDFIFFNTFAKGSLDNSQQLFKYNSLLAVLFQNQRFFRR